MDLPFSGKWDITLKLGENHSSDIILFSFKCVTWVSTWGTWALSCNQRRRLIDLSVYFRTCFSLRMGKLNEMPEIKCHEPSKNFWIKSALGFLTELDAWFDMQCIQTRSKLKISNLSIGASMAHKSSDSTLEPERNLSELSAKNPIGYWFIMNCP